MRCPNEFLYDVCLITTSAAMAVVAADRATIPQRWFIVYATGVASVVWRMYRVTCNVMDWEVNAQVSPLFWHDFLFAVTILLWGFAYVKRTRTHTAAALSLMSLSWVFYFLGYFRTSCIVHGVGHLTIVLLLTTFA